MVDFGLMSSLIVAMRTLAGDVAVSPELLGLFVVQLGGGLFGQLSLVVQLAEEVGGKLMVRLGSCSGIDIKRDAELVERVANHRMVAVHHVLRGDAFLTGPDGNGHAVFVAAANEHDVALLGT